MTTRSELYTKAMAHEDALKAEIKRLWGCLDRALNFANDYGGTDSAHHKTWVIDQMVRQLTGEEYGEWVRKHKDGKDGPDTYGWEIGIAP